MSIQQIQLNGTETVVNDIKGYFAIVNNVGKEAIFASLFPNISDNMEKAIPIQPYATICIPLPYNIDKVYLLGSGTVIIKGIDNPCGATDTATRFYVDSRISETAENVKGIISNPNLLINPDFLVNQRGETAYNSVGYTVDRWHLSRLSSYQQVTIGTVTPYDGGVEITSGGSKFDTYFRQYLENAGLLTGKTVTLSLEVEDISGSWVIGQFGFTGMTISSAGIKKYSFEWNEHSLPAIQIFCSDESISSIKIKWIKLELGSEATQFLPTNPALELEKCQRFFQIRSTGTVDPLDIRPVMRKSSPIITQTGNGWEYDSEINP